MTTEEFWDKYMNEDILEIFDITYDFFSKELPKEFIEDYEVSELIIETIGHLETAKEFDKLLKFTKLLKDKQLKLYEEYFQYFDDFLIDYYCFQNEPDLVEKAFSNFIYNPIQDFEMYLISFKKLLFYGYTDILDRAIIQNYEEVDTSDDLMGSAGFDLAMCKYYITLEECIRKNLDQKGFNKDEFIEKLKDYNFDISERFLSAVEYGISQSDPGENAADLFMQDRENYIITLEIFFQKYMRKRNFPFAISGRLWDKLMEFWEENNSKNQRKPNVYFSVHADKFEKFLLSLAGGFFIDNKSEMIAVLWGSVYIYDFLNSIKIIDQKTFDKFINVSRVLKGKVIGQFTSVLWKSNFVHVWEKPDIISFAEFNEEENIFRKSLLLKPQKFTRVISEIYEELNKIGELSEFIIEGSKSDNSNFELPFLEDFNSLENELKDSGNSQFYGGYNTKPIKVEKKVGRNEPCPCGSGKKYKKCCGTN